VVLRIGFNPTRSISPCYNNYTFIQYTVIQKIHTFTYISNLTLGRIAATHGRLNCIRQMAPMCTPFSTHRSASAPYQRTGTAPSPLSYFEYFDRRTCPVMSLACPFSPSKLSLYVLGPPESTSQTASWSVQPFLQGSRSWQTDRQTDHVWRYFVCSNRPHQGSAAMWPKSHVVHVLVRDLTLYFVVSLG